MHEEFPQSENNSEKLPVSREEALRAAENIVKDTEKKDLASVELFTVWSMQVKEELKKTFADKSEAWVEGQAMLEEAKVLREAGALEQAHITLCEAQKIAKYTSRDEELYNEANRQLDEIEAQWKRDKEDKLEKEREELKKKPPVSVLEQEDNFDDAWVTTASEEFGYEVKIDEDGTRVIENQKDGLRIKIRHSASAGFAVFSSLSHPENSANITFTVEKNTTRENMKKLFEGVLRKFEDRYDQDRPNPDELPQGEVNGKPIDPIEQTKQEILDLMKKNKREGDTPKE